MPANILLTTAAACARAPALREAIDAAELTGAHALAVALLYEVHKVLKQLVLPRNETKMPP